MLCRKFTKLKCVMIYIYIHVYSGHEISSLKVNYTHKKYFLLQTYYPKRVRVIMTHIKKITN